MAVNGYNTIRDMRTSRQNEGDEQVAAVPVSRRRPAAMVDEENSCTRVAIVKPYNKTEIDQQLRAKGLGIKDSKTLSVRCPPQNEKVAITSVPPSDSSSTIAATRLPLKEKKATTQQPPPPPSDTMQDKPHFRVGATVKTNIQTVRTTDKLQIAGQRFTHSRSTRYIVNIQTPEALRMIKLVDELNEDNPLYCTEYVEDIFKYMQESERQECYAIPRNFLTQHGAISNYNRAVLIDWLVQVHTKFTFVQETLHIAIDVLDRYLKTNRVEKRQLQLLGISSMFLASKYEELYPPCSADFTYISANTYSPKQICEMERTILHSLDYKINKPFSLQFLRRFSKVTNSSVLEHNMAKYILERAMMDSELVSIRPSLRAAAALILAYQILNSKQGKETKQILEKYTKFSSIEIHEAKTRLNANLVVSSHASSLNSIVQKYGSKDFMEVAKRFGVKAIKDKTMKDKTVK